MSPALRGQIGGAAIAESDDERLVGERTKKPKVEVIQVCFASLQDWFCPDFATRGGPGLWECALALRSICLIFLPAVFHFLVPFELASEWLYVTSISFSLVRGPRQSS